MSTNPDHLESLRALAPELVLTITAFVALFADAFSKLKGSRRPAWIALIGLCLSAALTILRGRGDAARVFAMIEVDHFAAFFQLLMSAGCALVVLLWMFGDSKARALSAEAAFLLLCALLGGYLMVGTNHALLLTLGFAILSLASCALVASDKRGASSGEVSMKLVVFGGFATALMLYGLSLLYGMTGSLDFAHMGVIDPDAPHWSQQISSNPVPVAIAMVLVLSGYAYKISLAPLHFWTPDVYEGSTTPVAAFLAVVFRVAGFGALLRFLSALFVQDHVSLALSEYASKVGPLLAILAATTMAIGSLASLRPRSWKRMLAYSSIAHTGFAMIGVACLSETGFSAALLYLASSTLMNAGAFAVLSIFERMAGSDRLDDMRGLGWKAPFVAAGMIVLLAGLTGLPPACGFYAKYRVFAEAWHAGLGWLVLVGVISTLISACAYFQLARVLLFSVPSKHQPVRSRVALTLAMSAAVAVLVQGIWTRPIEQWAVSALDLLRR